LNLPPGQEAWEDDEGITILIIAPAPEKSKPSGPSLFGPGVLAAAGAFALVDGPLPFGDVVAAGLLVGAGVASALAAIDPGRFAAISHEDFEEGDRGVRSDLFPDAGVEEIEAGATPPQRDDDLGDPNAAAKRPGPEIAFDMRMPPRSRVDFAIPFMALQPNSVRDLPNPNPDVETGGDLDSLNETEVSGTTELGQQSKERMQLYRNQRQRLPDVRQEVRAAASGARPVATLKANQNVAKVEWNIEGRSGQLLSASGSKQITGFVPSVDPEKALIPAMYNNRNSDTEYKLLNAVANELHQKYQGRETSGSITLFSEFSVCISCANVIKEFKKMFPLIDITVIAGPRQRRPASLSDKLPKPGPD